MTNETRLTDQEIMTFWRRHGGQTHGPIVEHVIMEERKFYALMRAFAAMAVKREAGEVVDHLQERVDHWQTEHGLAMMRLLDAKKVIDDCTDALDSLLGDSDPDNPEDDGPTMVCNRANRFSDVLAGMINKEIDRGKS